MQLQSDCLKQGISNASWHITLASFELLQQALPLLMSWRHDFHAHPEIGFQETRTAARIAELLDVPYAHLVFTLPHELNALARAQPGKLTFAD